MSLPSIKNNMRYFVYGANMSQKEIGNRLGLVDDLGVGVLDQYKIKFNKQSKDESGKANIVPDENLQVIGVVYRMSEKQIKILDKYEMGYDRVTLNVKLDNNLVNVEAYIAQQGKVDNDLLPTKEYLEKLIHGAEEHSFPPCYVQFLERTDTKN